MAIVVSDTSPIRALAHLNLLDLLNRFEQIFVPPAVEAELLQPPMGLAGISLVALPLAVVRAPSDEAKLLELREILDLGESEALALAIEIAADAVLIDEAAGRMVAKQIGLTPIGVLGILLTAKEQGHVARLRPLVDRLRSELNFFISRDLYTGVLQLAGEEIT